MTDGTSHAIAEERWAVVLLMGTLVLPAIEVTARPSAGLGPYESKSPPDRFPAAVGYANATWTNTIGAAELITVWTDPDFNANVRAAYDARVIEIPTPRWTAYDAAYYGVDMPDEVPMITQERAYTSPIWYTP